MQNKNNYAVVDLGSNTIRLSVYQVQPDGSYLRPDRGNQVPVCAQEYYLSYPPMLSPTVEPKQPLLGKLRRLLGKA